MAKSGWKQQLWQQPASGTLFNAFTTAKTVLNQSLLTIMSNLFTYPGDEMRIRIAGATSNIVTTPGTLQLLVRFGNISVWDSGAFNLNTVANTLAPFELDLKLTAQVVGNGTTAKLLGIGRFTGKAVAGGILMLPDAPPAQGAGFDSSAAQQIDIFAGFSINNAGNGIQIHQLEITSDN